MTDLADLDATAQAELVRRGEASPLDLVDAAITRIEKLNPELNAVIHPRFEKARAEAASPDLPQGPFRGVPFVLKDLCAHSAGDPFHRGMRVLRDLGWIEDQDSFVAARLRAAGFVFVGRANTPELGLIPTTEPEAYGSTRNPWDPARSPGGSSGGSAAAVASRMVPAAHATDGAGSIRIPASECGLVGLKPSRGRVSPGPRVGEAVCGLGVEGVVTRTARDAAAILDVLAGMMPGDPYTAPPPGRPFEAEVGADPGRLRVGLLAVTPGWDVQPHSDCVEATEGTARLLESLGHSVEESHPAAMAEPELLIHVGTATACDAAADLDHLRARTGKTIGPGDVEVFTWTTAELGRSISGAQLLAALWWLQGYARRMATWWEEFDLLLTPTLAEPPPLLGEFVSTSDNPLGAGLRGAAFAPFTAPFNATGQPAISLPLFRNGDGLPIGVQLVAAYGREDLLIRVASQLEEARPWAGRRPPVCA